MNWFYINKTDLTWLPSSSADWVLPRCRLFCQSTVVSHFKFSIVYIQCSSQLLIGGIVWHHRLYPHACASWRVSGTKQLQGPTRGQLHREPLISMIQLGTDSKDDIKGDIRVRESDVSLVVLVWWIGFHSNLIFVSTKMTQFPMLDRLKALFFQFWALISAENTVQSSYLRPWFYIGLCYEIFRRQNTEHRFT